MARDSKCWVSLLVMIGCFSTITHAQVLVRSSCPNVTVVSDFNLDQVSYCKSIFTSASKMKRLASPTKTRVLLLQTQINFVFNKRRKFNHKNFLQEKILSFKVFRQVVCKPQLLCQIANRCWLYNGRIHPKWRRNSLQTRRNWTSVKNTPTKNKTNSNQLNPYFPQF